MATAAWEDVTPETIQNCWKHTGIQHNPITICLLAPTLIQQGWSIILKFASSPDVPLPQAEAKLQALFKNQYNNDNWQPALKLITKCEPEDNVIEAISKLRESISAMHPSSVPNKGSNTNLPEYDSTVIDLDHSIKTLKKCNCLFNGWLSAEEFIELNGKEEKEEVKLRTDDKIVEEVKGETAQEVVVEDEDDSDNKEQATLTEMMDAAMKLEKGASSLGGCGPELSNLCHRFRLEVQRVMILKAKQTTLNSFFVHSDP